MSSTAGLQMTFHEDRMYTMEYTEGWIWLGVGGESICTLGDVMRCDVYAKRFLTYWLVAVAVPPVDRMTWNLVCNQRKLSIMFTKFGCDWTSVSEDISNRIKTNQKSKKSQFVKLRLQMMFTKFWGIWMNGQDRLISLSTSCRVIWWTVGLKQECIQWQQGSPGTLTKEEHKYFFMQTNQ